MPTTEKSRRLAADYAALNILCQRYNVTFGSEEMGKLAGKKLQDLGYLSGLIYSKTVNLDPDTCSQDEINAAVLDVVKAYAAEF